MKSRPRTIKEALQAYQSQTRAGHRPSIPTLVSALKACSLSADLQTGTEIHNELIRTGTLTNLILANSLIDMFSKCSCMVEAHRIFSIMPQHSLVSWSSIILGYATNGKPELALQLFTCMEEEGCTPDAQLYVAALKACSSLSSDESRREFSLRAGRALHSKLIGTPHESNNYVANTLIDMYTKCGSLGSAREVFERMRHRDVVSWSALISGYVQLGEGDGALKTFSRMQEEGCSPDAGVFVAVLKACGSLAEEEIVALVNGKVVKPVSLNKTRELHRQLAQSGYEFDISVSNTLVDVYGKCGNMEEARSVFERIPHRSVVSWTGMITGYSNNDQGEEALEFFRRMEEDRGSVVDARVLMAVLKACGGLVRFEDGRRVHGEIYKASLEKDLLLVNSLLSFYGKCGRMTLAKHVFDSASSSDTVSWTSLIAGYSQQGETEQVFELFETMHRESVLPNAVTFLLVLTACSHTGRVEKGSVYFQAMSSLYSITPSIEHYVCMADILGRGNKLAEAVELVRSMPYELSLLAWRTVLAAARKWNNLDVGRMAFESVMSIDDRDEASYTLMENMYAARELWEESAKVAERRRSVGGS